MAFAVELVSPEGSVFHGEATMVLARTPEGEIAFQQGHIPFIGVLSGSGPVKIWLTDGTTMLVAVHSGFVQVSGDAVTILSDVAELKEQIDVPRAEEARRQAQSVLSGDPHNEDALAALRRANLRIQVATGAVAATAGAAH
jgi:F-type H+-transporting ATPase subunit epsilon